PGVGDVNQFGPEYAIRIWLDPAKLTAYNLTPGDALRAVREQNVQLSAGEIGGLPAVPGQQITATVVSQSRLSTPEQFGNILLKASPDGSSVRLRDVARVELARSDYSVTARVNGRDVSAAGVKLAATGNALETAQAVRDRLEELSKYFPPGVGDVNQFGPEYAIRIWLDPAKLTAYNLTPGDLCFW
ncbi:MAG: efflux transporter permease subunit, partial [Paucimonas sp.]|nr:efflux transporter permease subunit [Paucimonas sp.]